MMLVAVLCAGFTSAWGADETVTFSSQGYSNQQAIESYSGTNFSISFNKGTNSNAPKYYTSGTAIRAYGGNTITVSSTTKTIAGITITFGSSDGSNAITTNVGTYSNGTWAGEATSVTFTIGGTTGNRRLSAIDVTYKVSANTVATPTFNPAEGTYTSAQNVEISTTTNGATIYYTTDGTDPTTNSNVYSSAIPVSSTTSIKAMAVKDGLDNSSVASATYTIVNFAHAGTQADPYTVADARTAIDANVGKTGVYATGIVSEIVTAYSTEHENITFDIIDEGGSNTLRAYRCGGTDASDVAVGDIVVISGDLTLYGSTYEFNSGCTLVSLTHPVITTPTIITTPASLNGFTYETGNGPSDAQSFTVTGANLTEDITLSLGANSDFEISTSSDANYGSSLNLASSASDVNVYVRLKSGLAVGNYNGTITLSSAAAENVEISLAGSVTAPEAAHVTWDLSTSSYDEVTDADVVTWSSTYVNMSNSSKSGGTSASNYLGGANNRTSTRMYSGNTLTITPVVGYAITSVVFTATTEGYATALKNSTWTNATASAEGSTVTVTPTEGRQAISAALGGTCGFTSVKVYYVEDNTTYYDINIDNQVENGTISANLNKAEAGATVTLTATPDTYYELSGWTVLDGNAEEVTVTVSQENANVATFTMPSSDVEVSATFATTLTSYTITVDSDIENGTVEADKATAFEGATVTLTVTPATGFGLKTILAMTDGSDDVVLTKSNSTTYTFEMPADNVTVMAEFEAVHDITYTLASSITSGKHYVIASGTSDEVSVMGIQNTNNRAAVEGSVDGTTLSVSSNAGAVEFVIYGPDANNHYTIYDGTGYLYAAGGTSSNHLKTYTTLDEKGQWTITFNNETKAASIVANISGRNTMRYNSNSSIFSCYASGQDAVYLYEKDGEDTPTESVTVSAAGYATYVSDNALDFSKSSINAYIAIADGTTGVTFSQITKVPANTGVLLYKDGGATESIPSLAGAASDVTGNVFLRGTGDAVASVDGDLHNYILNKPSEKPIGFYRAAGQTVAKNRAYIQIDESTPVKEFISLPWDDVTGVNSLTSSPSPMSEGSIFNLAGQKMSKLQKGVNIVNGKKVLVK